MIPISWPNSSGSAQPGATRARTARPMRGRGIAKRRRPTVGMTHAQRPICRNTLGLLCNPTRAKCTVPLVYHLTAMPPELPTFTTATPLGHPHAHRALALAPMATPAISALPRPNYGTDTYLGANTKRRAKEV